MHSGAEEARKLKPYIEQSDAFSLEAARLTESRAKKWEQSWKQLLDMNLSRDRVLPALERRNADIFPDKNILDYMNIVHDYLFTGKVSMYYTERWKDNINTSEIEVQNEKGFRLLYQGLVEIFAGETERGIPMCYEGLNRRIASAKAREKNMAENLLSAEKTIKETFPALRSKDKIRLAIQIGAAHQLEKYTTLPLRIVDLTNSNSEKGKFMNKFNSLAHDGASIETLRPYFIEAAKLCVTKPTERYHVDENY